MWLSDLSIKQPVFITMLLAAVVTVGAISYSRMGVDLFPDVSFPVIAVSTTLPGAGPEEVETLVTKPTEEALSSLRGVEKLRSTSTEGVSTVIIEFGIGRNVEDAANEVRERLGIFRDTLPADAKEPIVLRFDPSLAPVMSFTVSDRGGRRTAADLRQFVEDNVKPRIERVGGVASVEITGGLKRQINVTLDLNALKALNVPLQQVTSAIKGANLDVPSGRLTGDRDELLLRTAGEFSNVEEIKQVVVAKRNGTPIYLKSVAKVEEGFKEKRTFSRLNGNDSVILTVQKQSGANTVRVSDGVKAEIAKLQAEQPDLDTAVVRDEARFIKESNQDVTVAILLGGLFAGLIVLIFFRDIRNTLVTVAGLPVILLGTFGAMLALGFSFNMVTLMGLSLSIGLLIDDAIVVRENILRHMEAGEDPKEAASKGTGEIAFAVLATTLSVVAVFLPMVFISAGFIGIFFRQFGATVLIAVLISLFEAFTLAPMLSAHFFKPMRGREQSTESEAGPESAANGRVVRFYQGLVERYSRLLTFGLHHRKTVVATAVAAFFGSFALLPIVGTTFQPDIDQGEFAMTVELPAGARLEDTDYVVRHIEDVLSQQPEVKSVSVSGGSENGSSEAAAIFVSLYSRGKTAEVQDRMRSLLSGVGKLTFSARTFNVGSGRLGTAATSVESRPILVQARGPLALDDISTISQQMLERLRGVQGLVDVDSSFSAGKPEAQIVIDRDKASDLGLNAASVGSVVRTLVNGETVSTLKQGADQTDILVTLAGPQRERSDQILSLPIVGPSGAQVPLGAVASIRTALGPSQINRESQQRQVVIGAGFSGVTQSQAVQKIHEATADLALPPGVTISLGGQARQSAESFQGLFTALVLAVLFVYMVLASQFGSFVHPFTLMLALPLSVVGAFSALLIAHKPIDVMVMIGLIMLMGLVTKNSILLIDYILRLRRYGYDRETAIVTAGRVRLRPILMTTFSMVFGMLPTAVGLGAGSEFRSPMATTVIGGLITSTLLTLVVVPVAYTIIDDLQNKLRRTPMGPADKLSELAKDLAITR